MRYSIEHYLTPDGHDLFGEWFDCLKSPVAKAQVAMRLDRVERGNFGDHKSVGGGVWELRIHISPGFRVYYSLEGDRIVLLLCGGDKSSQKSDIKEAQRCREEYIRREP